MMVASSQLSFYPQPIVPVFWSGHLHLCVSSYSGLLLTLYVSRKSHSHGTFKCSLMWCKEISSFRNVLTHTDFKCIILQNG